MKRGGKLLNLKDRKISSPTVLQQSKGPYKPQSKEAIFQDQNLQPCLGFLLRKLKISLKELNIRL